MLILKPDKIAIIVLHELIHILMQSPAGNAYTFCCENVGKIIKVCSSSLLHCQAESVAKIENDKKRKAKNTDLFVSGSLNNADLVPTIVPSNTQVDWAPDITFKVGGALLFLLQKNCTIDVEGRVYVSSSLHPSQSLLLSISTAANGNLATSSA